MAKTPKATSARERIEDGMREVGILLIAFAPLDAVLAERKQIPLLLLFLLLGLALFILAVVLETRHVHGRRRHRR